jgi:hypothetical protein
VRDVSARMIGGVDVAAFGRLVGGGGKGVRRVSMAYFAIVCISRLGELGMWKW